MYGLDLKYEGSIEKIKELNDKSTTMTLKRNLTITFNIEPKELDRFYFRYGPQFGQVISTSAVSDIKEISKGEFEITTIYSIYKLKYNEIKRD